MNVRRPCNPTRSWLALGAACALFAMALSPQGALAGLCQVLCCAETPGAASVAGDDCCGPAASSCAEDSWRGIAATPPQAPARKGCPVEQCCESGLLDGVALTYWAGQERWNPNGAVALCSITPWNNPSVSATNGSAWRPADSSPPPARAVHAVNCVYLC